jgi:hypothetical protein
MPIDYRLFYKQLADSVIFPDSSSSQLLANAKNFCFTIYDTSCDGQLDQVDLFQFVREAKSEKVFQISYRDIIDL